MKKKKTKAVSNDSMFRNLDLIDEKREMLSISRDTDQTLNELNYDTGKIKWYPMFLYIPNYTKFEHYHFKLTRSKAIELRDWLTSFLEDSK